MVSQKNIIAVSVFHLTVTNTNLYKNVNSSYEEERFLLQNEINTTSFDSFDTLRSVGSEFRELKLRISFEHNSVTNRRLKSGYRCECLD